MNKIEERMQALQQAADIALRDNDIAKQWFCLGQKVVVEEMLQAFSESKKKQVIDMLLFCPRCGTQHVDEPMKGGTSWTNPPHRTHLCHACGWLWRPSDWPTNGVATIETRGANDGSPQPIKAFQAMPMLCQCSGCSDEHKENIACEDPPSCWVQIGGMVKAICTECLVEFGKRLVLGA